LKASEVENVIWFKVGFGLLSATKISQGVLLFEYRTANLVSSGDTSISYAPSLVKIGVFLPDEISNL
jgi:hypothetical protein